MTSNETTNGDLAALRQLVDAYALAMDNVDTDAFHDLFVADGKLIVRDFGREKPAGVFRGPGPRGVALIATLMDRHYGATLHNITTFAGAVDGDRATGTTYCLAYHVAADGSFLETLGVRYEEEFVRTAEGWRFATRDALRLWTQSTPTPREPLLIDRAAAASRAA